jgi:hypothetical protein
MIYTDVITQVKSVFPDIPSAKALEYCNRVNRELNIGLASRYKVESVNLTSGARSYDMPTGAVKLEKAVYVQSASVRYELEVVTRALLDEMDPLWDYRTTTSRPLMVCVDQVNVAADNGAKLQVTLFPTPNTTTSASYPVMELRVATSSDVVEADDILPATVSGELYKAGICYFHAMEREYGSAKQWQAEWERQKSLQLQFETRFTSENSGVSMVPLHVRRTRR